MSSDEESDREDSEEENSEEESGEEEDSQEENEDQDSNKSESSNDQQNEEESEASEKSSDESNKSDRRSKSRKSKKSEKSSKSRESNNSDKSSDSRESSNSSKSNQDKRQQSEESDEEDQSNNNQQKSSFSQFQILPEASPPPPQYKSIISGLATIKEISNEMDLLEQSLVQKFRFFSSTSLKQSFLIEESPPRSFEYEKKNEFVSSFDFQNLNLNQQVKNYEHDQYINVQKSYRNKVHNQTELPPINYQKNHSFKLDLNTLSQIQNQKLESDTEKSEIGVNTELIEEKKEEIQEEFQNSVLGKNYRQEVKNYPVVQRSKIQQRFIPENQQGVSINQLYKHSIKPSQASGGRSFVSDFSQKRSQRSNSPQEIQKAINILLDQDQDQK